MPQRCTAVSDKMGVQLSSICPPSSSTITLGELMRQQLDRDEVSTYVDASPYVVYDLVADVTRTPELSTDVVQCSWIDGASGPEVGARFKAVNTAGRGPKWSNKPVITVADRGREFAFSRTELIAGTLLWRYRFTPEGRGTKVTESYEVTKTLPLIGWFVIGTLYGQKDRRSDLHTSMQATLERLRRIAEKEASRAPG
jgi:hypothetical protein